MFTKTTIVAIRLLILLCGSGTSNPLSLRTAAERLDASRTYLAKVARLLVKAGLLRASRGIAGGVALARAPSDVSLRQIVEACQGLILGDFCAQDRSPSPTCAFHQASAELHDSILRVLTRWTLSDLARRPAPAARRGNRMACWMEARPTGVRVVSRS